VTFESGKIFFKTRVNIFQNAGNYTSSGVNLETINECLKRVNIFQNAGNFTNSTVNLETVIAKSFLATMVIKKRLRVIFFANAC
jgi:hypothetical protein